MKLSELTKPVETLGGIGPAATKQFARLNIFTIADLLKTYPRDYEDRLNRIPLCEFASHQKVHTVCKVTAHEWFGYGRMKTLKIAVTDGSASAYLIAFNRSFLEKSLPEGCIVAVTGQFSVKYNELQSTAFEADRLAYEGELSDYENISLPDSGLLPVYSLTEGLSQKNYRKAVAQAVRIYASSLQNELPEKIISENNLLSKASALMKIHCPSDVRELEQARRTLIYEELYQFEYTLAKRILEHRGELSLNAELPEAVRLAQISSDSITDEQLEEAFEKSLSPKQKHLLDRLNFSLTRDQKKVILEMNADIDKSQMELFKEKGRVPFSMQRLLQGDVGSGKTLVCFMMCLRTIDYGGQCALLAPTELLARQHAENASKLLEPLGIKVAFLTGNLKAKGRGPLLDALKNGTIHIIIGTHALFSTNVIYNKLSLAVIDEQHRFGVTQREAIVAKGRVVCGDHSHSPDLLMMSATPIPQSLALTVFGDLDVSTIKTMPCGRKPIQTFLSAEGHEANVYEAVRKELQAGHQAYFVYPAIGTNPDENQNDFSSANNFSSENGNNNSSSGKLKSAEEMYDFLSKKVFPEFRCGIVHGKMEDEQQNEVLEEFIQNKIQLLVATTVVEVGVDVGNATCMVIEHADHFGLAELHQLRGRTGRSSLQSYCYLVYSKNITETGKARMKAIRQSTDGFVIAEEDLKLRGPGEINGSIQSGYIKLGIADPVRDREILLAARRDAFNSLKENLPVY